MGMIVFAGSAFRELARARSFPAQHVQTSYVSESGQA
jgi:predicted ATP-grasp superfamily ATP-dependent carboligase